MVKNSPPSPPSPPSPHPTQQPTFVYLQPSDTEEEVDLLDLWRTLFREKWLVMFFACLGTAIAVAIALTATHIYRVEVLLEQVSEKESSRSGLMAQYGGLAAMAGINIGGGENSGKSNMVRLQSRSFIEAFLKEEKLLPILFYKQWDPKNQTWMGNNPKKIPTLWEGVNYFRKILEIVENQKNGTITLSIEWHDRKEAARWANLLVERINRDLRKLAITEAKKSMEYLNSELAKTSVVELQQAIINLLETQIKTIMMSKIRTEFAFKIIDPAIAPPEYAYTKPKRKLIVILGFVLGGILGVLAAFFRNSFKHKKMETEPISVVD